METFVLFFLSTVASILYVVAAFMLTEYFSELATKRDRTILSFRDFSIIIVIWAIPLSFILTVAHRAMN